MIDKQYFLCYSRPMDILLGFVKPILHINTLFFCMLVYLARYVTNHIPTQINKLENRIDRLDNNNVELSNKTDNNYKELSTKMDNSYKELSTKMDSNYKELSDKMDSNYKELSN